MTSKILDFLFGYEHSEEAFEKSRLAEAEKRFHSRVVSGIGSAYSKKILSGKAARFVGRLREALLHASIKNYGILFLAFGVSTLLLHFAEYYFEKLPTSPALELTVGSVFTLLSLPLLFIDAPLAESLQKWNFTDAILYDVLCLRRPRAAKKDERGEVRLTIPITMGVVVAILAFLTSVPYVLLALGILLFLALAISSPEFSFMITLLCLPLIPTLPMPTLILSLLVGVTAISFVIKVALGKRLFHFEQYDAVILLFALFILISGIFNKGLESFEKSIVLILLLSAYFLANNLIVNRRIAENSANIIIFASIPTAIYGTIHYFVSPSHPEWIDPSFEGEIASRAYATFGNPNVYAVFLIVTTILSFAFSVDKAHRRYAPFYITSFILNLTALVLTWSRGAWLAVIISALAFALIRSRRSPKLLLIPTLLLPVTIFILPENIINRLLSSFNTADSSIAARLSIWRSSLAMLADNIFIGVGVGEDAFSEEFLKYAEDSVTAPHSHNLFLEIGCEVGIFALVLFLFLLLIRVRHRATYAKYVRNSSVDNLSTISGTVAFALLAFGMTDYIWYSSSMYFLFWVIFGIGSATLRISKKEYDDSHVYTYDERGDFTAEINVAIDGE